MWQVWLFACQGRYASEQISLCRLYGRCLLTKTQSGKDSKSSSCSSSNSNNNSSGNSKGGKRNRARAPPPKVRLTLLPPQQKTGSSEPLPHTAAMSSKHLRSLPHI